MAIASPVDEDRATRITEAQPRSCDAYRARTLTSVSDRESNVLHKLSSGGPEASIHLKVECILHSSVYRDALRACAPLSQRRAAVVRSRCEYRSSDGRSVNSRNYNKSSFYTRIGSHSSARGGGGGAGGGGGRAGGAAGPGGGGRGGGAGGGEARKAGT